MNNTYTSFESALKCRCGSSGHFLENHSENKPHHGDSRFFITESKPHFSPDRLVDIKHIKLEISVDLNQKLLKGSCTQTVQAVAPLVNSIRFDAIDLKVDQVQDGSGAELKFHQSDDKLHIYLKNPLKKGQEGKFAIRYWVQEPRAGLYFIAPDKDYPNRPLQLWTQGQDEDNRYWFPCHDSPNEKATTEMVVTVDEKYTAISNGKLVNVTRDAATQRKTYHWSEGVPHASYLVTLCIGEFIEIKESWKNSKGEEIPVYYYTLLGREKETKHCFGKTPKMMEFFSKKTGVDYPYEKYAQVVAWDFIYGGMENTSATTQTEYTLHPESIEQDHSSEPLVAHELAHQWFGDLLTCKNWGHGWLNEGFATYFETLWTEEEHGQDEFLYELYLNEQIYKEEDSGAYRRPIVTNVYLRPSDIFDRHLYEKGGRVLHMLRRLVGDEVWWQAINTYLMRHKEGTVETVDLRRAFEEVSGKSLDWFFDQWVFKAGHPEIKAGFEWAEDKKQIKITVAQKQKITSTTSLFKFPLLIKVVTISGEVFHEVEVEKVEQTFTLLSSEKPKFVSLNVQNTVLGSWEFKLGRELLINQLSNDSDVMGRIFAVNSLAKDHSRSVVDALGGALKKEKFWGVQADICRALGSIGSPLCQKYLLETIQDLKHPKARKAALDALGNFKNEATADLAEKLLKEELSPLVQYAAGFTLGKTKVSGVFEKLSNALSKRESWHDYYDCGILMGLSELKTDDRVFSVILKYTKPGKSMFLRRTAVDALARWGSPRPSLVLESLLELLKDQNFFVKIRTIDALESLKEDAAIGPLQKVVRTVVDPRQKRHALMAVKSLSSGKSPNQEVEKLKAEIDLMRMQYSELLGRIENLEPKKYE